MEINVFKEKKRKRSIGGTRNNREGKKMRSITLVNAVHCKHVVFSNCLHTILIISTPVKCHESAHITMSKNTKRE